MDEDYPTSSTIPFPYSSGPYSQQAALMDTMLQSLRIVDEEQRQQQKMRNGIVNNYEKSRYKKSKANVMLLESPTGTGKSLSLACASLAWLRYREKQDLNMLLHHGDCNDSLQRKQNNNSNTPASASASAPASASASASASSPAPTKKSWLKDWIPPEDIAKQKQIHESKKQCYQRATLSRDTLHQQLNNIRTKLHTREISKMKKDDFNNHNYNNKCKKYQGVIKGVREEIVKESIDSVLKLDKHQLSKDHMKRKKSKSHKLQRQQQQNNDSGLVQSVSAQNEEETDFCVDEYHSDNELKLKNLSHKRRSSYSDQDDDDDDDGDDFDSHAKIQGKMKQQNDKTNESTNIRYYSSAQSTLDGGQLDGSGLNYRRKYYDQYSSTTIATTNTNNDCLVNETKSRTTVGNCEAGSGVRKIIYAARTHSQLSQFVNEIRRTAWGNDVRVVALGSRKLLCGNKDVTGSSSSGNIKRSEAMITEKCLDLQKGYSTEATMMMNREYENDEQSSFTKFQDDSKKRKMSKSKKKNSCPLLSSKEAIATLALHMLAKPSDIEDLVLLGESSNTCSYYASREALKAAEVVVVPYNTLLSKPARRAVGLSLQGSLVIIDEAHNIPETLRGLSSCQLTLPIIEGASLQLTAYVKRYSSRLAGKNVFFLGQLRKILLALSKHLKSKKAVWSNHGDFTAKSFMVTSTELFFTLKLDNINLFNIMKYLERTRLSQKLHGFTNTVLQTEGGVERKTDNVADPDFISKHISCMSVVETFLKCLTGTEREGRVIIERPDLEKSQELTDELRRSGELKPCYRYLLLDPSIHFNDVIDEAHAIVLAGGTLRPFPHIATELFGHEKSMIEASIKSENECKMATTEKTSSYISRDLTTFVCDHVVPSSNVSLMCLSYGPNKIQMDFRHSNRSSKSLCNELGATILSIAKEIPGGFIVFFPSYTYEAQIVQQWKQSGMFHKINQCKRIFREPKSASDVEKTLGLYSSCALKEKGSILFCVINGKMSEGINFSDHLARGILIVGLPYPDITDPELQEKMKLLDKDSKENKQSISGSSYYQNLCMRAVNQSIGRAIRHINDYATIILADDRYVSDPRIWNKLPAWLKVDQSRPQNLPFDQIIDKLQTFFSSRQS